MNEYLISMSRIWDDEYFFELHVEFKALDLNVAMNFYTSNESIYELSEKLLEVSRFDIDRIVWVEGKDEENSSHFVKFEVYRYNLQGHLCFGVTIDNKLKGPSHKRCKFANLVEAGSVEVFAKRIIHVCDNDNEEISGILSCR